MMDPFFLRWIVFSYSTRSFSSSLHLWRHSRTCLSASAAGGGAISCETVFMVAKDAMDAVDAAAALSSCLNEPWKEPFDKESDEDLLD